MLALSQQGVGAAVWQPNSLQATLERAYSALANDDADTALALARELHRQVPDNAVVLRLLGLACMLKGAVYAELSCRYLNAALAKGADDIDVHIGLAKGWLHLEHFEQARGALDAAARSADADYRLVIDFYRGLCAVAEQDWPRAIALFEALQSAPPYAQLALGWLGVIAATQGNDAIAMHYFEQLPLDDGTLRDEDFAIFRRHWRDILANRHVDTSQKRILTLRHAGKFPNFYQLVLDWIASNYPQYRSRFELRLLPCPPLDYSNYALHLPWLQDPVEHWSAQAFAQACAIDRQFDERGVKVINPVSRLHLAGKREGARRMAALGLHTPTMVPIDDFEAFKRDCGGLAFPFFLRGDWGHGGEFDLIENSEQLERADISKLRRPIAVEFIDTRGNDGRFRKYRYFAIGDYGISYHLIVNEHWIARRIDQGVCNVETRAEELAYTTRPDRNHVALQKARLALKLDVVAFDYSYDLDGRMVVWEANPYPYLRLPVVGDISEYRFAAIQRTLATMLLFYLQQAGIVPPPELHAIATYAAAGEAALAAFTHP